MLWKAPGTDFSYADYQADPSKTYMKPFVNTVFDLATNKISNVEPVATVPQLFTNIPEAAFAVEDAGSSVTINGLQDVAFRAMSILALSLTRFAH